MKSFFLAVLVFCLYPLSAQQPDNQQLQQLINRYQTDARGPYKDIRWFCADGTFAMPKESCPQPGGVQRARYKDEVISLAKTRHIFLGQILSTTSKEDFWDAENYNSRLKQYQLEKYLRAIDDGWVLRKARYYRGAFQIEDEEAWGVDFFQWLLARDAVLEQQFFLIRQAAKDIPHRTGDNRTLRIRAVSKAIADSYPAFMDLRVKIHGQPEAEDLSRVRAFRSGHSEKLSPALRTKMDELIADLEAMYSATDLDALQTFQSQIPKDSPLYGALQAYLNDFCDYGGSARARGTAELLAKIRRDMHGVKSRKSRLALLDLSNALEEVYFTEVGRWNATTVEEGMEKICYTGMAAMGTGFIEIWEWEEIEGDLSAGNAETVSLAELQAVLGRARSLIEWGTGMVNGVYRDVINLYGGFEPQAYGFFDDRIRSSVLLSLGEAVGELGQFTAVKSRLTNAVMKMPNQSTVRGLNPGYARGELVVISDAGEDLEVSTDKIYIFHHPPADLKPVAGILTVTEGNMVSHVQLLARNLGIPNAVISTENMDWLRRYAGQEVFYAVSNRGTVIMKPVDEMEAAERDLFTVKKRSEERIRVPTGRMELARTGVLDMRNVNASSSGVLCGPKAANLGQLKVLFPELVVEGLVLPFGVFRQHMEQAMPGQAGSYWDYLNETFRQAEALREQGEAESAVESFTLEALGVLREAIKNMDLLPAFVNELEQQFEAVLGDRIGQVPVFLRSDTNMEDLKEFTGAGLNLTLFNVVDRQKIMQGIKDVWASPYTERSFKWRQSYLLNPENVYPSILIIPSVDVEYSGVLITKGIPTADGRDLTVAFSRGAGGAVDGQAAEAYLLHHRGENMLLSPAREPKYRRLPETGGSDMLFATFEDPILNAQNLFDLRMLAYNIYQQMPREEEQEVIGPFDVELGFTDDKIWLFQIRPFVENKTALSSAYLDSISPRVDGTLAIAMDESIN